MQFPFDQSLLMPTKLDASVKQANDIYSTILNMLAMPEMMKTQRATAQEALKQKQLVNQYYPVNELLSASRVQNQMDSIAQSKNRFGAGYLFSKEFASLPPQEKKQYFADHPGSYEMLMAAQGNKAMQDALTTADNSRSSSSSSINPYIKQIHDLFVANGALPSPDENSSEQDTSTIATPQAPQTNTANSSTPPPPQSNAQAQVSPTPQQIQLLQQLGIGQPGGPKIPLQPAQSMNQGVPPQMANPVLMPPQAQPQLSPQTAKIPPQNIPPQAQDNPNAPYSGDTSFTPTNAQVASAANSAKLDTNRSLNSAQLNSRIDAGEAIGHLFEQPAVLKNLATLTKYSGVEGKAKLAWARAMHPKEWLEYQNAADQLGTIISGSLKGIENIPTSNEGMRTGKDYINKANILATAKGDPAAVANYLVNGIDLITDEQNSLLKTGQKAYPDQIPQHQHLSTMLDDIAKGADPKDVLNNRVSAKAKGGIKTKQIDGKWMAQDPETGQWKSEDDL